MDVQHVEKKRLRAEIKTWKLRIFQLEKKMKHTWSPSADTIQPFTTPALVLYVLVWISSNFD